MTDAPTLASFLERIGANPDSDLAFATDGRPIRRGYHVTEIRYAAVTSLDCGGNGDAWDEAVVQLLDGPAVSASGRMPVSKFQSIARRGLESMPEAAEARVVFEYAPGNGPAHRYDIAEIDVRSDTVHVGLTPQRSVCKPAASAPKGADACCSSTASACCAG